MTADPVRAIADAVLYEGYILWPYNRSTLKNQRRFTFGGVYPPGHASAHPDDPSRMQTEVLLLGRQESSVSITVRFLHVVQRTVMRAVNGDEFEPVDELVADGERYLSWEEAVEREIPLPALSLGELPEGRVEPIDVPAGDQRDDLGHSGAIVRSWHELRGAIFARAAEVDPGIWRLTVEVVNQTPFAAGARQEALERTFCSTHTLLRASSGEFVSLADPPARLADAAAACRNLGTWPVPVGERGARNTILSSPIILEDYPRIAPESPGDLFDGGEIDQLLILNILTLTDEEKAEMAASDPRGREILERTEALSHEQLMALHGTIREFGMAR